MIGFQNNNKTWILKQQATAYTINTGINTYKHQPTISVYENLKYNEDDDSKVLRSNEITFWAVDQTKYSLDDFFERYYGITFKMFSTYQSVYLVDFYATQLRDTQTSTWAANYNNSFASQQMLSSKIKWFNSAKYKQLCHPGYRNNHDQNKCVQCQSPCKECSFQSESKCMSCPFGYVLSNYDCTPVECTKGQYFDMEIGNCKACPAPCTTCDDNQKCTYCVSGYKYVDDGSKQCLLNTDPCPGNTYIDPDGFPICRKCGDGCYNCTDSTTCLNCYSGFFLTNGKCEFQKCPPGTYNDTTAISCKNCSSGCDNCFSSTTCNQCQEGYYNQNGQCKTSCPVGHFKNGISNACQKCQADCLTCQDNNYTCTSCATGSYLYQNRCIKSCPLIGYFYNTVSKECTACDPKCEMCIASATDCVSCKTGYLQLDRKCQANCDDKYYATTTKCYPCDISCSQCQGSTNTQCQACNNGYYLMGSSCISSCPLPYFGDPSTRQCSDCRYYCDRCTGFSNCNQCKYGYIPTANGLDCNGEYFLKTSQTQRLELPINPSKISATIPLIQATVEIWFKSDNILSSNTEVILGMTPYKLRKKQGVNLIQLIYQGQLFYCENVNAEMKSDLWYHFAFTLNQANKALKCYFDGESYDIGTTLPSLIASDIVRPEELVLGGTTSVTGFEKNFNGLLREFRFWNITRSDFDVKHFRYIDVGSYSIKMIAYWKLDEKNDGSVTKYKDSASGSLTLDPQTISPALSVQTMQQMKEVYLKTCSEGYYPQYDEKKGYFQCKLCNSQCKNCKGPNANDCTDCNLPQKLIQDSHTCVILEKCPDEFYQDEQSGLCFKCNQFCKNCIANSNNCPQCKVGFFREYQGIGCVDKCPNGMYGNYQTQECLVNPRVDYLTPPNQEILAHGSIIELQADFTMLNDENIKMYNYGWKVIKNNGQIDISVDAVKQYYQTSLKKVRLDNNIIRPNNWYTITFYVSGNDSFVKGMYSHITHQIYIGMPPRGGKCQISPLIGIAQVTQFSIKQMQWVDEEPLYRYDYFYSTDGGQIYIPIETDDIDLQSINHTFTSTYDKYTEVRIRCQVTNTKGFSNMANTIITLERKSNANAFNDLKSINPENLDTELEFIQAVHQLKLISKDLGDLDDIDYRNFDPKLEKSQCNSKQCYNRGNCIYLSFSKQYYCNCTAPYSGQNCSFADQAQQNMIKTLVEEISISYSNLPSKGYELEFLKLCSFYTDQINEASFGVLLSILNYKIINQREEGTLNDDAIVTNLNILSNLIEYLRQQQVMYNVTKSTAVKNIQLFELLQQSLETFEILRQQSLNQINNLTPEKQFISRMLSYKQIMINQESLINIQASNSTKKNQKTWIKISPINFQGMTVNVPLEQNFIVETIEYAFNPYQIINTQNVAGNIFDIKFYNASSGSQAFINNLTNGFQLSFPILDNYNLSEFMNQYNDLSPYKAIQNLQRTKMLAASNLSCIYWDNLISKWSKNGCVLLGNDKTHIQCSCNHLTSFSIQFKTPNVASTQIEQKSEKYQPSQFTEGGEISLTDLRVPLKYYMKNLQELLQHKQPDPLEFFLKPGIYVIVIFWFMYITGVVYYSGRDQKRRYKMTKSQNRDDLAEITNPNDQNLMDIIKELIVKDYTKKKEKIDLKTLESPPKIKNKQGSSMSLLNVNRSGSKNKPYEIVLEELEISDTNEQRNSLSVSPQEPQDSKTKIFEFKMYEDLSPSSKKQYKKRAQKKILGRVGSVSERARRFFKKILKNFDEPAERKNQFFYESLKSTLWMGLMSTTSKVAPRHVRLTLLYLYVSLHLIISSCIYIFGYSDQIQELVKEEMISYAFGAIFTLVIPWIICVPVALIFRMPLSVRRQLEGVKTRKINMAFIELDQQMSARYAIGYFICYTIYILMTLIVIFFNYVYPSDYCLKWFYQLIVIYFLDLIIFTFGYAGFQLINAIIAMKLKFYYRVWAFFEIIRYYKNLRG
ncbi:neurohypophysial n-terminal domain containing protein [Stylonychia lemnae]|uniref:Neurohypophysial n-terminal domain containing protein n=1 Tax=Stylonychia lemnae TaxID=5949 RepID=A0A078AQD0_STYLE|nr:neurohypophysial n-terminal domain containing protein [Stylonychia lemnae]|eukprot:CDW84369.1 neurohypophysial n-terminal domain containing protein [Stylonychia lemnae]